MLLRSTARAASLAQLVLLFGGCSNGEGPAGPTVPVASIEITGRTALWPDEDVPLTATARAASGAPLPGRTIAWSSSDPGVAAVSAEGVVTAHGAGSAEVTASIDGKSATRAITVAEFDLLIEASAATVPELLLLDSNGGEPARLFPPGMEASDPVPSPDGTRIAFVVADYVEWTGDIYVANLDGSGVIRLTSAPQLDDQPAWSPDGSMIAFRSYRLNRDGDIWVMNADGANPRNLTPDPLPGITDESRPAWSPDGARIAYASTAGGTRDIWTMCADGTDKRRITNTPDLDTEPAWSPDGARIAFRRSSQTSGTDIWLVPAGGGVATRIDRPGSQLLPAWSPDGSLIAFAEGAPGGPSRVFTMTPDGANATLRAHDGVNPAWVSGPPPVARRGP